MITIRQNIFETNSSSTHTMTITDDKTYEKWIKGELLYIDEDEAWCLEGDTNYNLETFVSKERAIDLYEQIIEEKYHPNFEAIFKTYSQWIDGCWDELYNYEEEYITNNGEKIVVFGKYGYQG